MRNLKLKTKIVLFIFLSFLFISNNFAQQIRAVEDFSVMQLGDSFTVIISQSDKNTVIIEADETIAKQIKTEVIDGVLTITNNGNNIIKPIKIGVKNLSKLIISGAVDIKSENQLLTEKIAIEKSGIGDVILNINAKEIITHQSGEGDLTLKGSTQILNSKVDGAGNLKASQLIAEKVIIAVSGVGYGIVNAKQSIEAEVSGSGNIIYKGKPSERKIEITGTGSIRESTSANADEIDLTAKEQKLKKKKYLNIIKKLDDVHSKEEFHKDSIKNFNMGFKYWQGFEFGINGMMDFNNKLDAPSGSSFLELDYLKSLHFGLNVLEKIIPIYKNRINFSICLGFNFKHYAFKQEITLNADNSYLNASFDQLNYDKNTLNISYIKAPFLLNFNFSENPKNNLHISAGAEIEYRIHSVFKQKYELDDKYYKIKQRDNFNLSPFIYSANARIGYNKITLFVNYSYARLFKKDIGPQVYPFTIGINLKF